MKKKTKVIVSSALSMAVCASLIAGSTFALFTSESKTNIAITSGKVSMFASLTLTDAYSAEWLEGATDYTQKDLEVAENSAEFTNGGTATYDSESNTLALNNISPGDGVEVELHIVNYSTIATKYRIEVRASEEEIMSAMKISYSKDGSTLELLGTGVPYSEWMTLDPVSDKDKGEEAGKIGMDISLPITADTTLQGQSATLSINVFAVQQNGEVGAPVKYSIAADPSTGKSASDAFDELLGGLETASNGYNEVLKTDIKDGDSLRLEEDIDLKGANYIVSQDVSIDLNNNEMVKDGTDGGTLVIGYTQGSPRFPEDTAGSAVIENGTIVADGTTSAPIRLEGTPSVIFRNVDFIARNTSSAANAINCYMGQGNVDAKVVFENCTFTDMILPLEGRSSNHSTMDFEMVGCTFIDTKPMGNGIKGLSFRLFDHCDAKIEKCSFRCDQLNGNSSGLIGFDILNIDVTVSDTTFTYTILSSSNSMHVIGVNAFSKGTFTYSNITVIGTAGTGLTSSAPNLLNDHPSDLTITASGTNQYTLNGQDKTSSKMP